MNNILDFYLERQLVSPISVSFLTSFAKSVADEDHLKRVYPDKGT